MSTSRSRRREWRTPRQWPLLLQIITALVIAVAAMVSFFLGLTWLVGLPWRPDYGEVTGEQRRVVALEVIKLALGVAAALGALVALVVAYRRTRLEAAKSHREDRRQFTELFESAAAQLGHAASAVRLAGVYAMARLADDWTEEQQACIDVLCAYLRLPCGSAEASPGEASVRQSLIAIIQRHLRVDTMSIPTWCARDFDFAHAVFDSGSFAECVFEGTVSFQAATFLVETDFSRAGFHGPAVAFNEAEFRLGADFKEAEFYSNAVFDGANFADGAVSFDSAIFYDGAAPHFSGATFGGAAVSFFGATFARGAGAKFDAAKFIDGSVAFDGSRIEEVDRGYPRDRVSIANRIATLAPKSSTGRRRARVSFAGAHFLGSDVTFQNVAWWCSADVIFDKAEFSSGDVFFAYETLADGLLSFTDARFMGGTVSFFGTKFSGSEVILHAATFSGGRVDFSDAQISAGRITFRNARFRDGVVDFRGVRISGGMVDFPASIEGGSICFESADLLGLCLSFESARQSGGELSFLHSFGTPEDVSFRGAKLLGGRILRPDGTEAPAGTEITLGNEVM